MKRGYALVLMGCAVLAAGAARAADTVTYYYTDAQGSPVVATDASGNVIENTDYSPYGQTLNRPIHDGPGYTGHEEDEATGLSYMQQRYYDPQSGQFISTDPLSPDGNSGASFNRYAYANDNPYRFIDPDGRCADHYKDGNCEVQVASSLKNDKQALAAQKSLEGVLNKYDKAINGLKDNATYNVTSMHEKDAKGNSTDLGKLSGKEIKGIWNNQEIKIVPNSTDFKNGGGGGATGFGLTQLTPNVASGWMNASPAGASSIVFHEFSHLTGPGQAASLGNAYDTSGPAFIEREEKVQTIGNTMSGTVNAPFSCNASAYGCF